MLKKSDKPFHFMTQVSLPFMTGVKAKSLSDFVEQLKVVPESVIYQHTHRFLQQHQELTPEPPNDFAFWIGPQLQLDELGEKFAAIDTIRFHSLNDLRQAFIKLAETYLVEHPEIKFVPAGREFHFMRSVRISLPTPYFAHNLEEFSQGLKSVTTSSLYFHIFEARLRPPPGTNDFSFWLEKELGEKELAAQINQMDPYTQTLEGLRRRILSLVNKRIKKAEVHALT